MTITHQNFLNRLARFAAVGLLGLTFMAPAAAHAALTTTFNGLPFNASNLVPGSSVSGEVTLANSFSQAYDAQIGPLGVTDPGDLSTQMQIQIKEGASVLYSGSLDSFLLGGERPLSSVGAGSSKTYTLTLTLDSDTPQSFQGKTLGFDLCVGFAGEEAECGTAFEPSPEPGPSTSSSGGGGSFRRSQGLVLGAQTDEEGDCPAYLTAYIRPGGNNNQAEVLKLQKFLRDLEGHDIAETGVYDAPTIQAVREFQQKYASQILSPWGASQPTGFVYYTTRKLINEIHCQFTTQFPLTAQQLAEIARIRAAGTSFQPALPGQGGTSSPAVNGSEVSGLIDSSSQPAAVGAASQGGWWSKFWGWLFGN